MPRTVLVSAGHSTTPPLDSGAVGNGYLESHLTLELRDLVVPLIRAKGIVCKTDGASGFNDPLKKAIAIAKGVDIAIEFHFDSNDKPSATGCEGIAFDDRKGLSLELAKSISRASGIPLHGKGHIHPKDSHRGRLGFCDAGGIIVECGFISNKNDVAKYQKFKREIAQSLADTIVSWAMSGRPLGAGGSLEGKMVGAGATLGVTRRVKQQTRVTPTARLKKTTPKKKWMPKKTSSTKRTIPRPNRRVKTSDKLQSA